MKVDGYRILAGVEPRSVHMKRVSPLVYPWRGHLSLTQLKVMSAIDIAAETLLTIGADPKHLGARLRATLVLHTWGSALTHHPQVHGIVPGGGLALDGSRWIAYRRRFFLPVRVLSRLF